MLFMLMMLLAIFAPVISSSESVAPANSVIASIKLGDLVLIADASAIAAICLSVNPGAPASDNTVEKLRRISRAYSGSSFLILSIGIANLLTIVVNVVPLRCGLYK